MTAPEVKAPEVKAAEGARTRRNWLQVAFVRLGVLPFLLLIAVVVFALMSDNFLTGRNLMNVLRQSTYLTMVAMGQMLALLTGGFDLSVGTMLALTSVVSATVMAVAETTEVSASMVPTERSKPPVSRASIWPMATMVR